MVCCGFGGASVLAIALIALAILCCLAERGDGEYHSSSINNISVKPPVVIIEESPLPTKSWSSPFQPTPKRKCIRGPARRGGSARMKSHRKKVSLCWNPPSRFDCGYLCVLRAAHLSTSPWAVQQLRSETSIKVKEGYVHDHERAGLSVRQVICQSDQSLQAYVSDVAFRQWSSAIELAYACEVVGVRMVISVDGKCVTVGPEMNENCELQGSKNLKPVGVITLVGNHWILKKINASKTWRDGKPGLGRGGMTGGTWTWETDDVDDDDVHMHVRDRQVADPIPSGSSESHLATLHADSVQQQQTASAAYSNSGQQGSGGQSSHDLRSHPCFKSVFCIIDHSVMSDVHEIAISVPASFRITNLQKRLGDLLDFPFHRISMVSENNDPLELDDIIPSVIRVKDSWYQQNGIAFLNVYIRDIHQPIVFPISLIADNEVFKQQLANVMGLDPIDIVVMDPRGAEWVYPLSLQYGKVVYVEKIRRGGMQQQQEQGTRSRSVSPTLPFVGTPAPAADPLPVPQPGWNENENNNHVNVNTLEFEGRPVDDVDFVAMVHSPPSSARSGSSTNSERVHAEVWERTPPPAQPLAVSKEVYELNQYVGKVRAPPNSLVTDVLADVEQKIKPHRPIRIVPQGAQLWSDVTFLMVPARLALDTDRPYDLRMGRWEYYQFPRHVPVLVSGRIGPIVVFPWHLSMQQAQLRLNRTTAQHIIWHLTATSWQSWVITEMHLPDEITEQLEELRELRAVPRGGARKQQDPFRDPRTTMVSWGIRRLEEHAPDLLTPAARLIIKAEARVATALMHSRSPVQSRQIMLTAFKRNNMEGPRAKQSEQYQTQQQQQVGGKEQPDLTVHLAEIYNATTNQTITINHILETLNQLPKSHDYTQLFQMVQWSLDSQQKVLLSMQQDISNIKEYLKHASLKEPAQEAAPPTPTGSLIMEGPLHQVLPLASDDQQVSSGQEHDESSPGQHQTSAATHESTESQGEVPTPMETVEPNDGEQLEPNELREQQDAALSLGPSPMKPSILDLLQAKSQQAQAGKQGKRSALNPFRAS